MPFLICYYYYNYIIQDTRYKIQDTRYKLRFLQNNVIFWII